MFVITRATVAKECDLQIDAAPSQLRAGRRVWFRDLPLRDRLRLGLDRTGARVGVLFGLACAVLIVAPAHPAVLSLTPVALGLAIVAIEGYALRRSPEARRARVSGSAAVATLLRFSDRAKAALQRIVARQAETRGQAILMIECSPLDRLSPAIVITVQCDVPDPRVLDLTAEDRLDLVCLFDTDLTEDCLSSALAREDRAYMTVAVPMSSGVCPSAASRPFSGRPAASRTRRAKLPATEKSAS